MVPLLCFSLPPMSDSETKKNVLVYHVLSIISGFVWKNHLARLAFVGIKIVKNSFTYFLELNARNYLTVPELINLYQTLLR